MSAFCIKPAGELALTVNFGEQISPALNARVRALDALLSAEACPGVVEAVPAYSALTVHYDPERIGYADMRALLARLAAQSLDASPAPEAVVELPVLYGGDAGPDLDFVCAHSGLSRDEVIALHAGRDYLIYLLGFTPGFPYLGGLDERLHTPRLETPRTRIPAGSVGIAGGQTGVYPSDTPGGWRIIGRTPVRLYDPQRSAPILLRPGESIRFVPIEPMQYRQIEAEEAEGRYVCRRYGKGAGL